jgi:hypothetical protein
MLRNIENLSEQSLASRQYADVDELIQVLTKLPNKGRLVIVEAYLQEKTLSAREVLKIAALFPEVEQLIIINNHIDTIISDPQSKLLLDKILKGLQSELSKAASAGDPSAQNTLGYFYERGLGLGSRSNEEAVKWYIKSGENIVNDLIELPEKNRFAFACAHQQKIRNGIVLTKVLGLLPEDNRLTFAQANQNKIKYGMNLPERGLTNLLKLLPQENRLVMATHYQTDIFSAKELTSVLDTLSPIDQLSLTVDYLTIKREKKEGVPSADIKAIKDFFVKQHHSLSLFEFEDINIAINSIRAIKDNSNQIKKTAETLARYCRNQNLLFSKIPLELTYKVASLAGNLQIHTEKEAAKIAIPCFELPQDLEEETSEDALKIRN